MWHQTRNREFKIKWDFITDSWHRKCSQNIGHGCRWLCANEKSFPVAWFITVSIVFGHKFYENEIRDENERYKCLVIYNIVFRYQRPKSLSFRILFFLFIWSSNSQRLLTDPTAVWRMERWWRNYRFYNYYGHNQMNSLLFFWRYVVIESHFQVFTSVPFWCPKPLKNWSKTWK